MKTNDLIASHVGETSLNPQAIKGFLQTPPPYRQWGVAHQLKPIILDQLQATDLFDFYLRLYLSGRHKTQQAVMREVRLFVDHDPVSASYFIGCSLMLTRRHLFALEWYELLPRLESAQLSISKVALRVNHPTPAFVMSAFSELNESMDNLN